MYRDVIQKDLSSNLEAFLIESAPFGFNPTKLTKFYLNGNEGRRTKLYFIFLKRQSKIFSKDNYTNIVELCHIVILVFVRWMFSFSHIQKRKCYFFFATKTEMVRHLFICFGLAWETVVKWKCGILVISGKITLVPGRYLTYIWWTSMSAYINFMMKIC